MGLCRRSFNNIRRERGRDGTTQEEAFQRLPFRKDGARSLFLLLDVFLEGMVGRGETDGLKAIYRSPGYIWERACGITSLGRGMGFSLFFDFESSTCCDRTFSSSAGGRMLDPNTYLLQKSMMSFFLLDLPVALDEMH